MKQKISIVMDEEIVRLAKERAAKEQRTLSQLIQETLVRQFRKETPTPAERRLAYTLFCEQPMKIPAGQLRYILEEDMWSL
jgi:hypothetical protein